MNRAFPERLIELINTRKGNALHAEGMLSFDDVNRTIWDVPCEIFSAIRGFKTGLQRQR